MIRRPSPKPARSALGTVARKGSTSRRTAAPGLAATATCAPSRRSSRTPAMAISKDFRFLGRLCLDFAQTGDMGWGTRYERLETPADLSRWLSRSPLALVNIHVSSDELSRAKTLRAALWRVASAIVDG